MAYILQIETSTASCSVALAEAGRTIAVKELNEKNIHASSVTLFVQEVLSLKNLTIRDLQAVAVSMGPGSYTGLRIGVSVAKGICYGLDIPLIAIETLMAMSVRVSEEYARKVDLLCPMIDARRMEVYTAVFTHELDCISTTEAKIIDEHSFEDLLSNNRILFFGDGALKCKEVLNSRNALYKDVFSNSASDLSRLAFEKFQKQAFENVAYFEPHYLKDFIVK